MRSSGNRFLVFIAAAFVIGILLLVLVKFHSESNINSLEQDNEQLVGGFRVTSELRSLESNIWIIENKIRGMVSADDTDFIDGLRTQTARVESSLQMLRGLGNDDATKNDVNRLIGLIRQKVAFSQALLDEYRIHGKPAAERFLARGNSRQLSDSIIHLAEQINQTRQQELVRLATSVRANAEKMERLDSALILFMMICAIALFGGIAYAIRNQNRLIEQVRASEAEALEAMRAKERFLANMSHEVRTPLNAVLGFARLLRDKPMDAEGRSYVRTLEQSGESLLALVNDLLDLSRLEAGMVRLERVVFSPRQLLDAVHVLHEPRAVQKNIRFSLTVHDSVPWALEGDPARLTQVLHNLVGNALKFTDSGHVSVELRANRLSPGRTELELTVADTGVGIAADKLPHIFDRFRQADDAVTRAYGGSGLGLSIVKELVTLQGGTVEADSTPGRGTSFRVVIPYGEPASVSLPHEPRPLPPESTERLRAARVLAVDDNEVNRSLLGQLFAKWGTPLTLAVDGQDALEKVGAAPFDLVLMDIQMPRLDGYSATALLRRQFGDRLPVIAMTAHALPGEREKCIAAGMNDFLSKPIREEELTELLLRHLPAPDPGNRYQTIRLNYMHEVSGGNRNYEADVTRKFLSAVPRAIGALRAALAENDRVALARLAHNLRSTVSVMGLNEALATPLGTLEHPDAAPAALAEALDAVIGCLDTAVAEAGDLLQQLQEA